MRLPSQRLSTRGDGSPFWETALIFALFFLYGCWPVPDVNEPYYVGKAIHFWNPNWFADDPFLNSPDSHWLFFAVFGFFSLFLKPTALIWFGRVLVWWLTAWGWRTLSWALIPRRWVSIVTAMAFLFYLENFHLAGEWIAGGVEGKGFAFPFLFFGLSFLVKRDYGKAFLLMGIASAFHVLVGGWGVLASLMAVLWDEFRRRFSPHSEMEGESGEGKEEGGKETARLWGTGLWVGLIVGGGIALIGLIPALSLDRGVSAEVRHQAHVIYVYERLSHHLVPSTLPWIFPLRFLLLSVVWFFFCRYSPRSFQKVGRSGRDGIPIWRRWNAFVAAALLFAGVGLFLDYGLTRMAKAGWIDDRMIAADLLRFYWFRLSDWGIPAGIAFGGTATLIACRESLGAFFRSCGNDKKGDDGKERGKTGLAGVPVGSALAWGMTGILLFVLWKRILLAYSLNVANEATMNPLFPVPPRPVDGIAFLAALWTFGILLALFQCYRRWKRGHGGEGDSPVTAIIGATIFFTALLLFAPIFGGIQMIGMKTGPLVPRSNPPKASISDGWMEVCRWAREETPEDAVFLVPRGYESWKWHSHRPDVGNWKEIPQDAASIVPWFEKMENLYTLGGKRGKDRWNQPLIAILLGKGEGRILRQSREYGYDYIVAEQPPYNLASFPEAEKRFQTLMEKYAVFKNNHFIVFRLPSGLEKNNVGGKINRNETKKEEEEPPRSKSE